MASCWWWLLGFSSYVCKTLRLHSICIHVLRLSDTTRIVCDPGLCRVFLVGKPRQRYFALNWWWPEHLKWCLRDWNFGETLGIATAVFQFTRQSGECILLERSDRGNFVSMKFSSFDNSKFSHFIFWAHWIWLYKCITVWEASFDFILNRFVPIWPEPELSYWRWQMNGSHVIGFKKVHSRWTVEYSQDCQLYSLDSSWIGRL